MQCKSVSKGFNVSIKWIDFGSKPYFYLEEASSWSRASAFIFFVSLNDPDLVNLSSDKEFLLFSVAMFSLMGARAGGVCRGLPVCLLCLSSAAELDLTRGGALSLVS